MPLYYKEKENTTNTKACFFFLNKLLPKVIKIMKEQLIEKKHKKIFEEFQYNYLIDSCCSCWYINAEHVELLGDL